MSLEPLHGLHGGPQSPEDFEYQRHRFSDGLIWIQDNPVCFDVFQPDGQGDFELSTQRFRALFPNHACAYAAQFVLRELPLEPEQHSVVYVAYVVDAMLIKDEGLSHGCNPKQLMPFRIVPAQA